MNPTLCYTGTRITLLVLLLFSQVWGYSQIKSGNSYVNISKRAVGGTIQPGDTLEIRTNYYIPTGFNGNNLYYIRYVDNIPTRTTFLGDSLRQITNEGITHKRWTPATGDDPGSYLVTPPANEYNIRINIGNGATAPANNTSTSTTGAGSHITGPDNSRTKPRVGGGSLITTSFRVVVTGSIGDTIVLGAGKLLYKLTNSAGDADVTIAATQYKIIISNNYPICPDGVGRNFVAEAGGTFDSGTTHNRSYGPSFSIPSYNYLPLTPANQTGDGNYTIVNNLSPYQSVYTNAKKNPFCFTAADSCSRRMFTGHWDIIGDHTGSSTPAGNLPAAPGARGGYMLVVNAAYATTEAYRQYITGLCPNTVYEFSLYVRNVCTNCGIDSNATSTWLPGVKPNLTFSLNGFDRYSSGQIDTVGWIKKGFLFKTGPFQTDIIMSIRNNASGGGGNDWAIDDIALVSCNPNIGIAPSPNAASCYGQQVDVFSVIKSYFDNYVNWEWDISTDNGVTWNSTGESGIGSPILNNGLYEYTAFYPPFLADSAHHGNRYRIRVASTATNLESMDCSFSTDTKIAVMINNCQWILSTKILSFTGDLKNGYSQLQWISSNEETSTTYDIERSYDGVHFSKIGSVNGKAGANNGSTYAFTDPTPVNGKTFYRLKVIERSYYNYSRIVLVSNNAELGIQSLTNPFAGKLSFDISSSAKGNATIQLLDTYGRIIRQNKQSISNGLNTVSMTGLDGLNNGAYTLRVFINNKIINKQVIKLNKP